MLTIILLSAHFAFSCSFAFAPSDLSRCQVWTESSGLLDIGRLDGGVELLEDLPV